MLGNRPASATRRRAARGLAAGCLAACVACLALPTEAFAEPAAPFAGPTAPLAGPVRVPVEVTATRLPPSGGRLDATAPARAVDGQTLRARHRDLTEAVGAQEGVQLQRVGGPGRPAFVRLRGGGAEQVDVYLDDVALQPIDGAPVDLEDIPLAGVGGMEIYRGTTPAGLGPPAIGGTLRLIGPPPHKARPQVALRGGSFGTGQLDASLPWGGRKAHGSVALRLLHTDGDFPFDDDGGTAFDPSDDERRRRRNNRAQRASVLARQTIEAGSWRVTGRLLAAGRALGVPGRARAEALQSSVEGARVLGLLRAERRGLLGRDDTLRVDLQSQHDGLRVDDRAGELGAARRLRQWTHVFGGLLGYGSPRGRVGPVRGRWTARASAHHGVVLATDTLGAPEALPTAERTRVELGLAAPLHDGERTTAATPSLSATYLQSTRPGRSGGLPDGSSDVGPGQRWRINGRLGGGRWLTEWLQLRGGLVRAVRVAHLGELYGDEGAILGNPALRDERAWTADLGLRARRQGAGWAIDASAGGFLSRVDDLIQLRVVGPRQARYVNVEGADIGGTESGLEARWAWLTVSARHTWLWTRSRADDPAEKGRALPSRPAHRVQGRAEAALPAGWAVFGVYQATSRFALDAAHVATVAPQQRVDLGARWQTETDRGQRWWLDVRLDNTLGAQLVDIIGFPLPGRAWTLGLGAAL